MIKIHQAIYGERDGHGLLNASDAKTSVFSSLGGYTDVVDRPTRGVLDTPIIRGIYTHEHFLLIKNFPDTSSSKVRAGRVFAHALFLDKESFLKIHDISRLFQYLLPKIDRNAEMNVIEYDNTIKPNDCQITETYYAATNALLKLQQFGNTIVFTNEDEYWQWIAIIWSRIPNKLKTNLRLGAAFGPHMTDKNFVNLLYIPPDNKPNWSHYPYKIVDDNTIENAQTESCRWLLNHPAERMEQLLKDFEPTVDSLKDLIRLEDEGAVYSNLPYTEIKPKLVLSYTIAEKSPNDKKGQSGKEKLLLSILDSVENTSEEIIVALQYQTWNGFPNAIPRVSETIRKWLNTNLLSVSKDFILAFAKNNKDKWWHKVIRDFLNEKLSNWTSAYANAVWNWLMEKGSIPVISELLPQTAERDLLFVAEKSESKIPDDLVKMCSEKRWLKLHAVIAGKLLSPEEAIRQQLILDNTVSDSNAMAILAKEIGAEKFIEVSVRMAEPKLYPISAQLISENPGLKAHLDLALEPSQEIWFQSIGLGCKVWHGIKEPRKKLFDLIDELLDGKPFNDQLLLNISTSDLNSLRDYPQRRTVWSHLKDKTKLNFELATLIDCFSNNEQHSSFEQELQSLLNDVNVLVVILNNKAIPVQIKLSLFKQSMRLTEHHALTLLKNNTFNTSDAIQLGKLASLRKWKGIAEHFYNLRSEKEFVAGLVECSKLLGKKKRFKLFIEGIQKDAIDENVWWESFLEVATILYETGPNKFGLWERAGGNQAEILAKGTGVEMWRDASRIVRLKYTGAPTIYIVLEEMLKDFPQNSDLRDLKLSL